MKHDDFKSYSDIAKQLVVQEMRPDIWHEITRTYGRPRPTETGPEMNERVTKEQLMENASYELKFGEGDWAVVGIPNTRVPWIVHYCYDQLYRGHTWNYALSSPVAIENYDEASHFTCVECNKKAPDNLITVLKLLT